MRLRSRRHVLMTGFGILIVLLLASTFTAYRVQETQSSRNLQTHSRYVQQQELLTSFRRVLWSAGLAARDYFIDTSPQGARVFRAEIARIKEEGNRLLSEVGAMSSEENTRALRAGFEHLVSSLDVRPEYWTPAEKTHFVQTVILPRRNAAGEVLRRLEQANHGSLEESATAFARTRNLAATRLLFLLAGVLLIGIVVAWLSLRYSSKLERQAALQFHEVSEAKRELERLSTRLMQIQEEERTRLARELHDEIVQTLAVLKIEITQAQSAAHLPEALDNLARARDLTDRTLRTCRNISLLLRPSLLDDLGLVPALQWLAEDFTRRTGVPCDFPEPAIADDLAGDVKTCVYRVCQEALHNAEKHAGASHVRMYLVQEAGQLTVGIADDGIGFDQHLKEPGVVSMHFGLLGMRERAAGLGGQLHLQSAPGEGTRVKLCLPLIPSSPAPEPRDAAIPA